MVLARLITSMALILAISGCAENQTKVGEGAALGGILGAVTGGVIGHQQKGRNDVGGALLGGVVGAAAGGIIGSQIPNNDYQPPPAVPVQTVVVQAPPPVQVVPVAVPETTYTVNVPRVGGGYVPVIIKRSGNGYIGPQGEYYPEFPTVAQLQAMYG